MEALYRVRARYGVRALSAAELNHRWSILKLTLDRLVAERCRTATSFWGQWLGIYGRQFDRLASDSFRLSPSLKAA